MSSSVQITTKNGRLIARISLAFFILANFYLVVPTLFNGRFMVIGRSR